MKLDERDLTDITAALVLIGMDGSNLLGGTEYRALIDRCAELHDRIQVIRRKNGTFESVDCNDNTM